MVPDHGRQPVHGGPLLRGLGHIGTPHAVPEHDARDGAVDNGAGISWSFSIAAGGRGDLLALHDVLAARRRRAAARGATPVDAPSAAFGPNGLLETPSNRRCISRRYFRIKLRKKYWPIIVGVTIKLPRTTRVLRARPWGSIVDLRGLPKGRFVVTITALTTTARTIKGTRNYRTCSGRLRGGKPKL